MGKIVQGVFGGSRSKQKSQQQSTSVSSSQNVNNDYLKEALSPQITNGNNASNLISSLLGLNGSDEGDRAFDQYRDSTGYDFTEKAGTDAITSSRAAKGLLGSGGTGIAINDRAQNLSNTFFNDYLKNLLGLNTSGNQAASVVSGTGNLSQSTSQSTGQSSGSSSTKPGISKFLGSIMSGVSG